MPEKSQIMMLTGPEIKLILRLRMLRKAGQTSLFVVSINPLSLWTVGNVELLEVSGSGIKSS